LVKFSLEYGADPFTSARQRGAVVIALISVQGVFHTVKCRLQENKTNLL